MLFKKYLKTWNLAAIDVVTYMNNKEPNYVYYCCFNCLYIYIYIQVYSDIDVEVGILKNAQCFNGRAGIHIYIYEVFVSRK